MWAMGNIATNQSLSETLFYNTSLVQTMHRRMALDERNRILVNPTLQTMRHVAWIYARLVHNSHYYLLQTVDVPFSCMITILSFYIEVYVGYPCLRDPRVFFYR